MAEINDGPSGPEKRDLNSLKLFNKTAFSVNPRTITTSTTVLWRSNCGFFSFTLYQAEVTWEFSAKKFHFYQDYRSPLSAKYLRYLLRVKWRYALPRFQSEEMKIWNISVPRVGIVLTTVVFTIADLCPCATTASTIIIMIKV